MTFLKNFGLVNIVVSAYMSGTNIQTFFDYFLVIVKYFNIFVPNNDD